MIFSVHNSRLGSRRARSLDGGMTLFLLEIGLMKALHFWLVCRCTTGAMLPHRGAPA